jgi:hypothetical protein
MNSFVNLRALTRNSGNFWRCGFSGTVLSARYRRPRPLARRNVYASAACHWRVGDCNLALWPGYACPTNRAPSASPQPQEAGKSLAEIVKESKKNKTSHAAKLKTEDDLTKGPFPKLSLDDLDSSDDIVDSIGVFQAKHTKEETEQAIHTWYNEYDAMLEATIRENTRTNERRADSTYNGYWICQNSPSYETCVNRHQAEMRGAHDDQVAMRGNWAVAGRIQQSFVKVRGSILRYSLSYPWFKIRNGNGIGSY